jgi:hypothetical protein
MNNVTEESKSYAIKSLAILGFIAAIIAGLWIVVQVIQYIPTAFESLANIADSIYGGTNQLSFKAEKDVVNSGESLRLTFSPVRGTGAYQFSYRCVDGVSAETRNADGAIVRFDCEKNVTVASGKLPNVDQVAEIMFSSEKGRFSDVPFTFSFVRDGSDKVTYEKSGIVTVVNATIPQTGLVLHTPTPAPVVTKPATTPVVTAPTHTPAKTTPVVIHKKVPVTVTSYPVSNPNGYTDLVISFVGAGRLVNGVVVPATSITSGDDAGLVLSVKNTGTKTSAPWSVHATFPGDEATSFTTDTQAPLLPGERATMTIRFTAGTATGEKIVRANVVSTNESDFSNNSFENTIRIVR